LLAVSIFSFNQAWALKNLDFISLERSGRLRRFREGKILRHGADEEARDPPDNHNPGILNHTHRSFVIIGDDNDNRTSNRTASKEFQIFCPKLSPSRPYLINRAHRNGSPPGHCSRIWRNTLTTGLFSYQC
jgi:hypothetical protein